MSRDANVSSKTMNQNLKNGYAAAFGLIIAAGCANRGATVFFDRPQRARERHFQERDIAPTVVALALQC
jgi:hypothetical protein